MNWSRDNLNAKQKAMLARAGVKMERKKLRAKYNNVRPAKAAELAWPEICKISFDSKAEQARAIELVILQRAKHIRGLEFHKSVRLTPHVTWKVDFTYEEAPETKGCRWTQAWEEFKGLETADYRVKRELWRTHGPGILRICKGSPGCMHIAETITPQKETANAG